MGRQCGVEQRGDGREGRGLNSVTCEPYSVLPAERRTNTASAIMRNYLNIPMLNSMETTSLCSSVKLSFCHVTVT